MRRNRKAKTRSVRNVERFKAFRGGLFSYGAVGFRAVLTNRTATRDFSFNKPAPHHTVSLGSLQSNILYTRCAYGGVRFLLVFTEPYRTV